MDGSLIVQRAPDAHAKPVQIVPKGAHAERVGSITVKPRAVPASAQAAAVPCPPVHVAWSLVREADGGRRFIVSSKDGDILGAKDVPIEPTPVAAPVHRWAGGISYGFCTAGLRRVDRTRFVARSVRG